MNDGQFSRLSLSDLDELCAVLGDDETKHIGLDRFRILLMTSVEPNCTEEEVHVLLEGFVGEGRRSYEGLSASAEELHRTLTQGPGLQTFLQLRSLRHASSNYDRGLFVNAIVQITDRHDAFISLPVTLIYIAVFVCIVTNHLQIYDRGKMEKALEAYVNGRDPQAEFDSNVDNIQSFWGWLLDEEGNEGGLKGPLGLKKASPANSSWPQYWLASRSIFVGDASMRVHYFNGTKRVSFLIHSAAGQEHLVRNPGDHLGAALAGAAQLRHGGWDDPEVHEVWLRFGSYGPRAEMFATTSVHARFTRSGTVVNRVVAEAMPIEPYSVSQPMSFVWDVLFVLVLIYVTVGELTQMCSSLLLGCGELWDYLGFWNVVDLVCIVLGFLTIGIWVAVCLEMRVLSASLPREGQELVLDVMSFRPDTLLEFWEKVFTLSDHIFALHVTMALNTIAIVAKFFKAFTSNPRLKVVTDTFHQASIDFAHFGVIFATIFLPFIIIGHVLFGNDIVEFSTIRGSINTGIVLLFGEFEWYIDIFTEYGQQGTMPSGMPIVVLFVWYVMYMFLVLIVLLNMLLAIIIEHYQAVTGRLEGEDAPTLWTQVRRYLKFQRETRRFLSLESLRRLLENDDDPAHPAEEVTEKSLLDAFPGMTEEQAMWLIRLLWRQAGAGGGASEGEEEVFDDELKALAESASLKLGFVEGVSSALGAAAPRRSEAECGPGQDKLAVPSMWDTVRELVCAVDRMRHDQERLAAAVQELGGPDPPAEPRESGDGEPRGTLAGAGADVPPARRKEPRGEREPRGTLVDAGADGPPARRREPRGTLDASADSPLPKKKERKERGKDEREPAERERKKERQKKPPSEPTVEKE